MTGTLEEHLGYISDSVRTERFRAAIAESISPGDTVVDLGCGFGILGQMCLEAGAGSVWGIDETSAIEIARESAMRAGFSERYHCLRDSSFRATVPERVDVIICDHIGYFGFDYGIVALLEDARRRLLKPGGKIVPSSMQLLVAGIASDSCREAATAWAGPDIPTSFQWLVDYGVNAKYPRHFEASEVATDEAALLAIDFHDDQPEQLSGSATVTARRAGQIDGIGGWFRAMLSPSVTMTNSPLSEEAINRDQAFFPFETVLPVEDGDAIRIDVRANHPSGVIGWRARNLRSGEVRSQNSWRSKILSDRDRVSNSDRAPPSR